MVEHKSMGIKLIIPMLFFNHIIGKLIDKYRDDSHSSHRA